MSMSMTVAQTILGQGITGSPYWLHWLARRHGGKIYLFAANDGDGEGLARFSLPVPPRSISTCWGRTDRRQQKALRFKTSFGVWPCISMRSS